ncbi:MAG: IPT/TIG domain-containing protein, partial [Candidatus Sericytochromatia bacterium]|nr:IPT/TIG domain-containing protein [Candidatus Tanganyikabacteria bacterium]
IRTIVLWNGTNWLSISNGSAGGAVILSALTTAVALVSALDPTGLPAANTIGKVTTAFNPPALDAAVVIPAHPDSEINAVATDLISFLNQDVDPFAPLSVIKPRLDSLTPAAAKVGDAVALAGAGFSPVPGGNTVMIGGKQATILSASPKLIIAAVPAISADSGVTVATARGTTAARTLALLQNTIAPVVLGVAPHVAAAGNTITITGQNFTADSRVNFQGAANQAPATAEANSVTIKIPSSALPGTITVSNSNGTSNQFFVALLPAITGLSATSGTTGSSVTLSGSGFASGGTVTIGNVEMNQTSYANNSIVVTVPDSAMDGQISVVTAFGTSNSKSYLVKPNISNVNPNNGFPESEITINGTGFGALQTSGSAVFFDNRPATITSWSNTAVKIKGEGGGPGDRTVTVKTANGTSNGVTWKLTWGANRSHYVWDSSGRMYVTSSHCCGGQILRESSAGSGNFQVWKNGTPYSGRLAIDPNDRVWHVTHLRDNLVTRYNTDGSQQQVRVGGSTFGLALDSAGNAFIGTWSNGTVYKVDANSFNVSAVFSGTSNYQSGLSIDAVGNVYFTRDRNGAIGKWDKSTGQLTTFSVISNFPIPISHAPDGVLIAPESRSQWIYRIDANGNASQWFNFGSATSCGDIRTHSLSVQDDGTIYLGKYATCAGSVGYRISTNRSFTLIYSGNYLF